jgi:hypothetical protein
VCAARWAETLRKASAASTVPGKRGRSGISSAAFPSNVTVFDPGLSLPPPPHDFVGRTETIETIFAAVAENSDSALLYGEPGCGKFTLALKFAWQTQGPFDAVVYQFCGQRPIAQIAAELAAKLKLGLERPGRPKSK